MDIGKAFSYVFEDQEWITKILIGGLIFLIPLIGPLVGMGYMVAIAENVARGNPRPLPEWSDFGNHVMRGLYAFVVQLVYMLPVLILYGLFFCVFTVIAGATGGEGERAQTAGVATAGALFFCFIPLIFILAIACVTLSYAGLARYIATGNLSEAFRFSDVISSVRGNFSPWIYVLLVTFLSGFVGSAGMIACGIGILFTTFYAQCVNGHALGQTIAQQGMMNRPPETPYGYNTPSV